MNKNYKAKDFRMDPIYLQSTSSFCSYKVTMNSAKIRNSKVIISINYEIVKLDNSLNKYGRIWLSCKYDPTQECIKEFKLTNYNSVEEIINTLKTLVIDEFHIITEKEFENKKAIFMGISQLTRLKDKHKQLQAMLVQGMHNSKSATEHKTLATIKEYVEATFNI